MDFDRIASALQGPGTGDWPDWIGLVLTLAGVVVALTRYLGNSAREGAIRAADEIQDFMDDPDVGLALKLIDWSGATIPIVVEGDTFYRSIGKGTFVSALRHHSTPRTQVPQYDPGQDPDLVGGRPPWRGYETTFGATEEAIRDIFDRFLQRLERIENLVRKRVIPEDDFRDHFSYWLEVMGEEAPKDALLNHFSPSRRRALWNYIDSYRFRGVRRLFHRYGRARALPFRIYSIPGPQGRAAPTPARAAP